MSERSAVRRYLAQRGDVLRVIITRGSEVSTVTTSPRGDGGRVPWRRYEGTVAEIVRMAAAEGGSND